MTQMASSLGRARAVIHGCMEWLCNGECVHVHVGVGEWTQAVRSLNGAGVMSLVLHDAYTLSCSGAAAGLSAA